MKRINPGRAANVRQLSRTFLLKFQASAARTDLINLKSTLGLTTALIRMQSRLVGRRRRLVDDCELLISTDDHVDQLDEIGIVHSHLQAPTLITLRFSVKKIFFR